MQRKTITVAQAKALSDIIDVVKALTDAQVAFICYWGETDEYGVVKHTNLSYEKIQAALDAAKSYAVPPARRVDGEFIDMEKL